MKFFQKTIAETSATAPKPPWPLYLRVARIIFLVYIGILVFLFFAQRSLIFQGTATQGHARVSPPRNGELLMLKTAGGDSVAVLFGSALKADGSPLPPSESARRPTLLFFYGNAMCLNEAQFDFARFRLLGVNVMIPEYPGYGMSSGEASEAGCYSAADAAYEHLQSRGDIDKSKIVVAGWSLGGAVAIDLASRKPVAGLMTFSTFTRMAAMGHNTYPFLPTFAISLILKHRFESIGKIPLVKCPILIGHSRGDSIIPFYMSDQLASAARTPVSRLTIEQPDHGDFFSGGGSEVTKAMSEFIMSCDRATPPDKP